MARVQRLKPRIANTRTHRLAKFAPVLKLAMKSRTAPTRVPTNAPDLTEILRQITPEGNVLRVDSRKATAPLIVTT
jgi:hypothetical protein